MIQTLELQVRENQRLLDDQLVQIDHFMKLFASVQTPREQTVQYTEPVTAEQPAIAPSDRKGEAETEDWLGLVLA